MPKKKKYESKSPFIREKTMTTELGKEIGEGDIIKIQGIWGTKFRFKEHVTNPENGAVWIDCYELDKGIVCAQRSFRPNRVKALPKKGTRRGNRARSRKAS
jgi:hypothetical protein